MKLKLWLSLVKILFRSGAPSTYLSVGLLQNCVYEDFVRWSQRYVFFKKRNTEDDFVCAKAEERKFFVT